MKTLIIGELINNNLSSGTLEISAKRSINCNVTNNAGGINSLNNVFINHFLDQPHLEGK